MDTWVYTGTVLVNLRTGATATPPPPVGAMIPLPIPFTIGGE